jgi:hypothetical protein
LVDASILSELELLPVRIETYEDPVRVHTIG